MNQAYQVKLDAFEGPLDLLLHLIKQYEIDIYDIPVAEITKQYNEYIQKMHQLELNIASEYLVMSATLLAIKSQMLLPTEELDELEDEYMEDPREELVQRLIEYKKYKEVAEHLEEIEKDAEQIFTRAPTIFSDVDDKIIEKGDTSVYDMLQAFQRMLKRKKWNEPLKTTVPRTEIPIEQRMDEVLTRIKGIKEGVAFEELFPYPSKSHVVITFVALLELMKANKVYCKQKSIFDSLYIFANQIN